MERRASDTHQVISGRAPVAKGRFDALSGVEAELAAERAGALGRAGTRLEQALAAWHAEADEATPAERDATLDEVARATYALLVQRDCAGFRTDNLGWIRRHYDIPDAALRRIGRRSAR